MNNFLKFFNKVSFILSVTLTLVFLLIGFYFLFFINNPIFNSRIENLINGDLSKFSRYTLLIFVSYIFFNGIGFKSNRIHSLLEDKPFFLTLLITYFTIYIIINNLKSLINPETEWFFNLLIFLPYIFHLIKIPIDNLKERLENYSSNTNKRIDNLELNSLSHIELIGDLSTNTNKRIDNLELNSLSHVELFKDLINLLEMSNNLQKEQFEKELKKIKEDFIRIKKD